MRFIVRMLFFFCIAWPVTGYADAQTATTIAVMPFSKLKGDKTVWLDKAIADLVAQKLSESSHYAVLNRDALQSFIKEMELQQSGFADDPVSINRVGKIAKVDEVIYGNYALDGDRISLHLMMMDVKTQVLHKQQKGEGNVAQLIPLCQDVVMKLLASQNITLSEEEKNHIAFKPTDSLSAIEHFYQGFEKYDEGDYETATGEFYAASRQDPYYLDARLWFGRMLEQLGKDEQAIIVYQQLVDMSPQSVEAIDARYFAARLQEKKAPAEAIKTYQALVELHPEIPQTLEAAWQQARLYRQQGESAKAYALYKQIDDFSDKVRKHSIAYQFRWSLPIRHSRFFSWRHALGLYREATIAMVELYRELPLDDKGNAIYPPPRGSFVINPANPVIKGDVKDKDQSLFNGDHTYDWRWSEMFYALIIPKGYKAVGAKLQITGYLPEPTPTRDFTLRVLPFPLPENYPTSWLGAIYGQTTAVTTLTKDIPFFGNDQRLLTLQLVENYGKIENWQVEVVLRKDDGQAAPVIASPRSNEGAELVSIHLGENEQATQSMPQYIMQHQPRQKLAMVDNFDDGLWLVGVKGELYGQETDLWITHSQDGGKSWAQAEPMSVNSASMEFAPSLIRAEDGALQLFFLSNRRGLGWELWTSRQDRQTKRWSHASLIPIQQFAPTGLENGTDAAEQLLPYAAMQDNHGQLLVSVYSKAAKKMLILASSDLEHWNLATSWPSDAVSSIAIGQDDIGRYTMASVGGSGSPEIRQSNDAKAWVLTQRIPKKYNDARVITVYPFTLLKQNGGMTLLFSDHITGLQYAPISAVARVPEPDLVTGSGLEPYAMASFKDGFIAALWKDDAIHIQRYHHLAFVDNPLNKQDSPIYIERSFDNRHGQWDRIIARERYRVPDVTSVGTSPGGRAWWGVEAGMMSLKSDDFFFTDVSLGFFTHYIDTIKSCGASTWFASTLLNAPKVGYSTGNKPDAATGSKPIDFTEMQGSVTGIACGDKGDSFFVSSQGDILHYQPDAPRQHFALPKAQNRSITALAYLPASDALLIGTSDGVIYAMTRNGDFSVISTITHHKVNGLALDASGMLWAAYQDKGVLALASNGKVIKTYDGAMLHANIRKLVADAQTGVWAMADSYSLSQGLLHINLKTVTQYNPPQKTLHDIIDFDRADDNSLWIGTNSDGIYHYQPEP